MPQPPAPWVAMDGFATPALKRLLLLFVLIRLVQSARPQHPSNNYLVHADAPKWGAFVLNLDRNPTRLVGFMHAVKEQEPWLLENLERIAAVDGKTLLLNSTAIQALVPHHIKLADLERARHNGDGSLGWEELSPGAVGLYLTHAIAWQRIKDSGVKFGMVFEDDLRYFSKHFRHNINRTLDSHLVTDFAYLQHCEDSSGWPRGLGYSGYTPWGNPTPRSVRSDEIVPCTAAYILSQKAARQLLKSAFPITAQLDRALSTRVGDATLGLQRHIYEPALAQVGPISFKSEVQTLSRCETVKFRAATWVGMWITHIFPC